MERTLEFNKFVVDTVTRIIKKYMNEPALSTGELERAAANYDECVLIEQRRRARENTYRELLREGGRMDFNEFTERQEPNEQGGVFAGGLDYWEYADIYWGHYNHFWCERQQQNEWKRIIDNESDSYILSYFWLTAARIISDMEYDMRMDELFESEEENPLNWSNRRAEDTGNSTYSKGQKKITHYFKPCRRSNRIKKLRAKMRREPPSLHFY